MNSELVINALIAIGVTVVLAALLALGLAAANKFFAVAVDERVGEVAKRLPGYNCGACGFPGCNGLAEALVNKSTTRVSCLPVKPEAKQDIINYLATTPGADGQTIKVTA